MKKDSSSAEPSFLKAALEATSGMLIAVDMDKTVIYVSSELLHSLGTKREEVEGRPAETIRQQLLSRVQIPDGFIDCIEEIYQEPEVERSFELPFLSDPPYYYRCLTRPLKDSTGKTVGRLWEFIDITEIKLTENFNETLLSTISHEIKTPLTSVQGYLETVLNSKALPEKQKMEFLQTALRSTLHLTELLDHLLDTFSPEAGQQKTDGGNCEPAEIVANVLDAVMPAAKAKQQNLETSVDRRSTTVAVDGIRLYRVLLNLVDNAIKYSPEGSRIEIAVKDKAKDWVRISIRDEGPGIPPGFHEKIFDRFFRMPGTKSKGTGLGLSIVKDIVESHGGNIELLSEPGGGAEFSVDLPQGKS